MITRETEAGETLLHTVAGRLGVRLVALVPRDRRVLPLWFVTDGDPAEVAALEGVGRTFLAEAPASTGAYGTDAVVLSEPPGIALAAVPDADGTPTGVLVAAKEPGQDWSETEQALLLAARDHYGPALSRGRAERDPTQAGHAAAFAARMHAAAERGELFLRYQPEVDLTNGRFVAVEALARWSHPDRGELGPDSFIALAEQSDLIRSLGRWVIDESLHDFSTWRRALPGLDIVLRVNVSPAQLDTGFPQLLRTALVRHGVPGDRVCLELTENVPVVDVDRLTACLAEVRALGVSVALDDLASGYSTLGRLRAIAVDYVKIDRSLVAGIDRDPRARAVVAGLLPLALAVGAAVVAEGVENAAEADTLRALGCTRVQGHFFARPMSARELFGLLRRQSH
ncbi:MAG TPA: EAL domain-containing protein [Jatrophihabitans sp.]|nr:EAL domain-containing protein [Jatrophihabitans sp.]